ncbi:hypothetical protein [Amycolatopsis sp. CA-230715]|uniref:hypothetical protein n=1 Tax=Amycolatopsis sp. CA-230715 TaxID=2745196 RepID=UPI001C01DC05|nr:hypothetical protein [Amycolatopsis sp. CA-230715]QWF80985.1 hypothetical protein HUW46_04410 [Amycolatopsis sp. CA-230715]
MSIGVSGHQNLPALARARAEKDIRALLARQVGRVIGLSSLAAGADHLFAELLVETGHRLHAVIPCRSYQETFTGADLTTYLGLRAAAHTVTELDFPSPSEKAFDAAGKYVVEHCDLLVAVWDGRPAHGLGGTGDAVARARKLHRDVLITWPEGVRRT